MNADAFAADRPTDRLAEIDARGLDQAVRPPDASVADASAERTRDAAAPPADVREASAGVDRPRDTRPPPVDARVVDAAVERHRDVAAPPDLPAYGPMLDAAADAPADATTDATADAAEDVAPDAPADVAGDVAPDAATDLAADMAPDLAVDMAPPTGSVNGSPCSVARQCLSGNCVDNHCCSVPACPGDCNFCLGPGGTCTVRTRQAPGLFGCITRFACDENRYCRRLTGQSCRDFNDCLDEKCIGGLCVWMGYFRITPELVDFGTVALGASATATYRVVNAGGRIEDPVEIVVLPIGQDDFEVIPGVPACGNTLAIGGTCSFSIRFTPTTPFPAMALVQVKRGILMVTQASVGGSTQTPDAAGITPSFWDHGTLGVGQIPEAKTFVIANPPGGEPVDSITLEGRDSGDFAMIDNRCPAVLPPGESCTVFVSFVPTSSGPKAARLVVTGNAGSTAVAGMYGWAP
jgi:hypothetical protein